MLKVKVQTALGGRKEKNWNNFNWINDLFFFNDPKVELEPLQWLEPLAHYRLAAVQGGILV